jgi:hypothetical protein
MSGIEGKRAALELSVLFRSDAHIEGREAILHAFQTMLAEYLTELLDPSMEDGKALWVRAKAIGLIEVLTQMGVDMAHTMESVPVRRSVDSRIRQTLGLNN